MSDYMFMLESHLTGPQNHALAQVVSVAQDVGINIFLSGGAVRDMLGGFAVRDLDFVVEGNPSKLTKALLQAGAVQIDADDLRKAIEFRFPTGVAVGIAMSAREKYAKAGGKPQMVAAPIYDHLRTRDFTVNAIALSLNRGSRGLLIDPTNGISDLNQRELRTISNYTLYDNPARILRLIRLQVRLGFTIEPRTQQQYANVREAGIEQMLGPDALRQELVRCANEPNPGDLMKALDQENLLRLFSPALTGAKINHAGFQKLQKAMQLIPYGIDINADMRGIFLTVLTERLTPKERSAFAKASGLTRQDTDQWQKLEPRAKKLEKQLAAAGLNRASQVYALLASRPGDEILFLLCRSNQRLVLDRLRNHLQKYLLTAQEVTQTDVVAKGGKPGTPKFDVIRKELIAARLDGRIRKPAPPPVVEPPVVAAAQRRFN